MADIDNKPDLSNQINNEFGQSFIEFLFLFLIMLFLSRLMIFGLEKGVGVQWEKLVTIIAAPTNDTVKLKKN